MSIGSVDRFSPAPPQRREDARISRRRPQASSAPAGARPLPVEIAFLTDFGVPVEALHYAAALARRQGVTADAALLAEGVVPEEVFYRALAAHLGVPYVDADIDVAPWALATASRGYLRLRETENGLRWLFAPAGAEIFRLMSAARVAKGRPLFAVTTRARFTEALRGADPVDVARAASFSAERVDRDLCVRGSLRRKPLAIATAAFVVLVASLFAPWKAASLAAAFTLGAGFLASVLLRLFACAASFEPYPRAEWIDDARLPVYTIVIALYKEAAVARQLARAIDRFDYPVLGSKHT